MDNDNYLNPALRESFEAFAKPEATLFNRSPYDFLSWNGLDYSDRATQLLFRAYCRGRHDERAIHETPTPVTTPRWGILAGEPEIVGSRCADGGTCHHDCTDVCFRNCPGFVPLSGSGLNDDWSIPVHLEKQA